MKQQFLRPFPRTATDRGAVDSSVTFIDVTLALIAIHNGWLQGCSTLVTQVTFCQLIMNIRPHVHVTFVLPEYCCLVATCPDSDITLFQLQCLASEVAWHSAILLPGITVRGSSFSALLDRFVSQEKKNYCPYTGCFRRNSKYFG